MITPEGLSFLYTTVAGLIPVWDHLVFIACTWYHQADLRLESRYYE